MAELQFSVGGEKRIIRTPSVQVHENSGAITVTQADTLPTVPYGGEQTPFVAALTPSARSARAALAPEPTAVA